MATPRKALNGTARKILGGVAALLIAVLAWVGQDAITQARQATTAVDVRLDEHCEQLGHPGALAIVEHFDKRLDRIEQQLDRLLNQR